MHSVRHPCGTRSFTIHSKRCLVDSTEIMEGRHIRLLWKLNFTFGRSKYNLFRNGGMSTIRNKAVYISTLCSTRVVSQIIYNLWSVLYLQWFLNFYLIVIDLIFILLLDFYFPLLFFESFKYTRSEGQGVYCITLVFCVCVYLSVINLCQRFLSKY